MALINVIPAVKEYKDLKEKVKFRKLCCKESLTSFQVTLLYNFLANDSKDLLTFYVDKRLKKEAYKIIVNDSSVDCYFSDEKGKHNAILTLVQLLKERKNLTTCIIKDEPDFEMRSLMIDISRNKVPNINTVKKIIDEMALLKMNDLQLYVEGRSFYFESLDKYYENGNDFLTGEDVKELSIYAKERGIDLTPNFNCYGHMAYWLNQKDLKHLAINDKGFTWPGSTAYNYPQTINAELQESKDFLFKMFDDILKYYPNIDKCTIGGDEPFELLFPVRHERARELYETHISDVIDFARSKGKTPYMWSDVARHYPDMLEKLKDVVLLDWCYEASWVNNKRMSFFKKYDVPFIICPGTSGWFSFAGRMENMLVNYKETAYFGKKYKAKGYMLTDWNDGGSLTQLVSNIAMYVYGACFAWNGSNVDECNINKYLNNYIYHNDIASSVIELGKYNLCQDKVIPGMPKLFNMFFGHQLDGLNFDIGSYSDCAALANHKEVLNHNECEKTLKFLDKWIKNLKISHKNEYTNELMFEYRLIKHTLNMNIVYLKLKDYRVSKNELEYLLNDINLLIKEYKKIWNKRNKLSDFKYSLFRFELLKTKYKHYISIFNKIEKL